jgi:EAL domain-containing protein (putative c-di-GMP-specific phosphodiesterase class I)
MGDENADLAIVQRTIDLGRTLGLDVVAEGVETREVWERLRALGCKSAQGYYLSRPVPPEELSAWFRERQLDQSSFGHRLPLLESVAVARARQTR